jgi:hypothetical protein
MTGRGATKKWIPLLVGAVLLVVSFPWIAEKAYKIMATPRELRAIKRRLPELPQVHVQSRQHPGRFPPVWLHRVNSVQRAVLMSRKFRGLEVDVVYDSAADYFDVGHPPVPSEGISLDQIFSAVPLLERHFFWIDFKNLTESNEKAACQRLLAIGRKYGIVSQMIVESTNPKALSCFAEGGFYTSYYLFPETKLAAMDRAAVTRYYQEVRANLKASRVNALSSDYRSLPFIERYFPDADILLWYLKGTSSPRDYAALAYLRLKPRVKVILVEQRGPGYR